MYTHPDFARQGVGRTILGLCEAAAAAAGFTRVELGATLAGMPLYRACGYVEMAAIDTDTPSGVRVPLRRMQKNISAVGR
jgi:GNAT superfamily N-acetyltransferase